MLCSRERGLPDARPFYDHQNLQVSVGCVDCQLAGGSMALSVMRGLSTQHRGGELMLLGWGSSDIVSDFLLLLVFVLDTFLLPPVMVTLTKRRV